MSLNAAIAPRPRFCASRERFSRFSRTCFECSRCPARKRTPCVVVRSARDRSGLRRRRGHRRRQRHRHGRHMFERLFHHSSPPKAKQEQDSACGCPKGFSTTTTPRLPCVPNPAAALSSGYSSLSSRQAEPVQRQRCRTGRYSFANSSLIAAISSGASGSVSGEKRFTTSPLRLTQNFSKFHKNLGVGDSFRFHSPSASRETAPRKR